MDRGISPGTGCSRHRHVTAVDLAHLLVEREQVVDVANEKEAAGQQPDQAGHPLAHVEAVEAEDAQGDNGQDPGDAVIERPDR